MPCAPSAPAPQRRAVLRALGAGALACVGATRAWGEAAPAANTLPTLRLLAHGSLPAGETFEGTVIGGLSALAYDARTQLWYALSDDRGRRAPSRCYVLRLPDFSSGVPLRPEWVSVITLTDEHGQPFARNAVDPEGLALRRDPASGQTTLLWSSEGRIRAGVPPAVYESTLEGRTQRQLTLPTPLREVRRWGRGPRNNQTLEGLALTPDARHAWAAMEGPLEQDEGVHLPGLLASPCRITRLDLATGRADRQVAYEPEPLPWGASLPNGPDAHGIAEILMRDDDHLWVLERAWSPLTGVSVKLYEATLTGATDTLRMGTLRGRRIQPAAKRLLLDLHHGGLPHVDNFEGMAWGPPLPNGHRTLLMCTDDNFNALQVTQFAAFEVIEP